MPAMSWSIWSAIALRLFLRQRVGRALHDELARGLGHVGDLADSVGRRHRHPALRLLDVARSCCLMPASSAAERDGAPGRVRVISGRLRDRLAGRHLAARLRACFVGRCRLRSERTDRDIMLFVMRVLMALGPTRPGAVDQRVEHLVGGRHRARRPAPAKQAAPAATTKPATRTAPAWTKDQIKAAQEGLAKGGYYKGTSTGR